MKHMGVCMINRESGWLMFTTSVLWEYQLDV